MATGVPSKETARRKKETIKVQIVYDGKEKEENIRCLCPKCLSDYIDNPNYIVRRLDPFAKEKDRCDKCDKAGWDYVVTERSSVRKGKSGSYEK